jgi:probable rRNA maturation factor
VAVDVFGADEQQDHPMTLDRWIALARDVLEDQGVHDDVEVSVVFVDQATIASLNERFRSHAGPTDVLAFPIDDVVPTSGRYPDLGGSGPGTDVIDRVPELLGDVVICPAVAAEHASDHGVTLDAEIALLVVHGILHLLGMDHEVPAEAEAMEARERELLARHYPSPGRTGR